MRHRQEHEDYFVKISLKATYPLDSPLSIIITLGLLFYLLPSLFNFLDVKYLDCEGMPLGFTSHFLTTCNRGW